MFLKVVIALGLVAIAQAQYGGHGYGHQEEQDYHAPAHYSFHYAVEDHHTGDIKSQHEERNGDHTNGVYSLVEPDGTTRTVHYSVEGKHGGFNAQVERKGHAVHAPVYGHQGSSYGHGSSYGSQGASYGQQASYGHGSSYGHGHATSSSSVNILHNNHHGAPSYNSHY